VWDEDHWTQAQFCWSFVRRVIACFFSVLQQQHQSSYYMPRTSAGHTSDAVGTALKFFVFGEYQQLNE
jgi:hypothetical protein